MTVMPRNSLFSCTLTGISQACGSAVLC